MCIVAPGDVSPGHMMLAPCSTNLIAPVSTRSLFCSRQSKLLSSSYGRSTGSQ